MGRQLLRWLQEALLLKDHRCEGIGPLAPCGADYGVGDSIQEQEGLDEQMTAADGLQPGTVILLSKNGKIRDNLRPATRVSLVWALDEEHPTVITAPLGGGGGTVETAIPGRVNAGDGPCPDAEAILESNPGRIAGPGPAMRDYCDWQPPPQRVGRARHTAEGRADRCLCGGRSGSDAARTPSWRPWRWTRRGRREETIAAGYSHRAGGHTTRRWAGSGRGWRVQRVWR